MKKNILCAKSTKNILLMNGIILVAVMDLHACNNMHKQHQRISININKYGMSV